MGSTRAFYVFVSIVVARIFSEVLTVGDIWKDRRKIEGRIASSESVDFLTKRCIVCNAKYKLLDKACWTWFCQQYSKGAPAYGVLLQTSTVLSYGHIQDTGRARSQGARTREVRVYFCRCDLQDVYFINQ